MTTFVESTLRHDLYEDAYDLVTALLSGSVTVTAAYTDEASNLPELVIEPLTIETDDYMLDRTSPTKTIPLMMSLYTKRAEHLDIYADLLDTSLTSQLTSGTSKWVNMNLVKFTEDTAHSTIKDNKVHSKIFVWIFNRK